MLDIDQIFVITAVGIETSYGLEGPGFEPQEGRDFPDSTSPSPRPTQPAVLWALGLFRGGKAAGASRRQPTPF